MQSEVLSDLSKELGGVNVPVLIIGDSAFRLSKHVMKPFPFNVERTEEEKKFNYHLSKCRRVVENAFGHLKARFRRLGKGIDNLMKHANLIIKACCVLHNFLNETNDEINDKWTNEPQKTRSFTDEIEVVLGDTDQDGEGIRRAIASHLSKLE